MAKGRLAKQIGVLVLALIMVLGCLPGNMFTAKAEISATVEKVADPGTLNNWKGVFGNTTDHAGGVWTDKSVFTSANAYVNATDEDESSATEGKLAIGNQNFLVALSAVSSTKSITGYDSLPTDTVFILDMSSSMQRAGAIDDLANATDDAINTLLNLNNNNRVGVVLYSSADGGKVLMPLDRYTTTAAANASNRYLQPYDGNNAIQVLRGVSGTGSNQVAGNSDRYHSGTFTQDGIYMAMKQLYNADKTVKSGIQAGTERIPIIVLMSDGAPTLLSTDFSGNNLSANKLTSSTSSITEHNNRDFMTQVSGAYAKWLLENGEKRYQEHDLLFYTLGMGSVSDFPALLPQEDNDADINNYWNDFLSGDKKVNLGSRMTLDATASHLNGFMSALSQDKSKNNKYRAYVDQYFPARNADQLNSAFKAIVDEIVLQSMYYPTLTDGNVHKGGYIEFFDYIGANMEVRNVKGLQFGANLYTGENFARQIVSSSGTVGNPTELGDRLVNAVRERLQLTAESGLSLARDVIGKAYNSGQISYQSANNFSNYIGWYADANDKYLGWWDGEEVKKVSGAEYAVKSYFFLDALGSSHRQTDTLYAMVQVRTHVQTGVQEVHVKLPASMIPLVSYEIKLADNNPANVESVTKGGTTFPVRLVYEVGLSRQIDLLDLQNTAPRKDELSIEYTTANKHGNQDSANQKYVFYTNEWQRGFHHNTDGHLPGLGEYNTHVFFQPSKENEHYYYHQDMPIYVKSGSSYSLYTGSSAPDEKGEYYRLRYVYHTNGNVELEYERIPDSALDRANISRNSDNQWVVKMGTVFRMNARGAVDKTNNITNTLPDSEHTEVHNVSSMPYHIDSIHGNNGKLTLDPYQGVKVTKQLISPLTASGPYQFQVTANVASAKLVKEVNGVRTESTLNFTNSVATFELNVGETAWVLVPANTQVKVEEIIGSEANYELDSINGNSNLNDFTTTIEMGEIESAVFANREETYGQLTISKDVVSTIDAHKTDKEFEFSIQVSGTGVQAGQTFPAVKQDGTALTLTAVSDGVNVYLKNGTENVRLKHLDNLTIQKLPHGTTVTVTEVNLPAGFDIDANKQPQTDVIQKGEQHTLTFTNTYHANPVNGTNIDIIGKKTLIVPENTSKTGTFEFVLSRLVGTDWTEVSSTSTESFTYTKEASEKTFEALNLFGETFDKPGTYSYRVHENVPADAHDGIIYDARNCYFDVVVADNGEGQLVISDVIARADTTVQGDETTGKWIVNVAFTNEYVVKGAAEAVLGIRKEIISDSGVVIPPEGFQFALYPANDQYQIKTGAEPIMSALTSSAGLANIGVTYQTAGTYHYVLKEIVPAGGVKPTDHGTITYGNTSYNVKVVVSHDNNGKYTIDVTIDGKTVSGAASDANDVVVATFSDLTFKNTYTPKSVELVVPLTGTKILEGRAITTDDHFVIDGYIADENFTIKEKEPAGSGEVVKNGDNWSFSMKPRAYTHTGTYYYVLKERLPDGATAENNFTVDGVTYDRTEYHVTVEVTGDNSTGKLSAQVKSVVASSTARGVEAIVFRNRYSVKPAVDVKIEGVKTFEGSKILQAGMFTFELHLANPLFDEFGLVQTTTNRMPTGNKADFAFSMTYDQAGIYYYVVKEQIPADKQGVTYDTRKYLITVYVEDNGKGQLVATVDTAKEAVAFTNSYNAKSVTVETITGTKTLTGDTLKANEFTFELWNASRRYGMVLPVGDAPVQTVSHDGNGVFRFNPLTFDSVGDYWYVVKETIGNDLGTTYDTTYHSVQINVTDNLNGQLIAETKINGTANGVIEFTNDRHPVSAVVTFGGKKELANSTLIADQFTFELYEADESGAYEANDPYLTANNHGDGTFAFVQTAEKELTYTTEGTWYYVIKEQLPVENGAPVALYNGVAYDQSEYFVMVNVKEQKINGRDTLVPTARFAKKTENGWVECSKDDVVFQNAYVRPISELVLKGTKTLTGRAMNAGEFTFGLFDETGKQIGTAANDAEGNFSFEKLSYQLEAGQTIRRQYTVKEIRGADPTITYDSTIYTVDVLVKDDQQGGALLAYTINGRADGKIHFENIYTRPKDVSAMINIQKKVKGTHAESIGLKDFEFVLAHGKDELHAFSDVNGMAGFVLTFSKDDIGQSFEFKVSEKAGLMNGMTYDPMVYTVVIHVGQNADGSIALRINGQTTNVVNLVFTNTYNPSTPPATGDRFPMALVCSMMLLSMVGAAAVVLSKRGKRCR